MSNAIYLDNHATTKLDPEVLEAMMPYLTDDYGNAASSHVFGMKAEQAIENARTTVATALGATSNEVFFTGGATESNNLVIKGVFDHFAGKKPHIITTEVEHKCILESCKYVQARGGDVTFLPVDSDGLISLDELKKSIKDTTVLVSVMHGNNEIGTIHNIAEIGKLCHEKGILFHTDAAQTFGKLPINVNDMNIDFLSASAHKIYGPKGVGFVYIRASAQPQVTPLLHGGGQENGMRSGTSNVPGIVGLGKATELAVEHIDEHYARYKSLRDRLYKGLGDGLSNLLVNGAPIEDTAKRLPHNLNIALRDIDVSVLKRRLRSIAFSSGSACSSADLRPSYVLTAIGRTDTEAHSSLRFGIGRFTTEEEIDTAVSQIVDAVRKMAPQAVST